MTTGTYRIVLDEGDRERFGALMATDTDRYRFTTDRVEAFAEATGDDQPVHVGSQYYLERFNDIYDGMLADTVEADGDTIYRNVVHGAYTLAASLAVLDASPEHLSARFDDPLFHAPGTPDTVEPRPIPSEDVHEGLHRYAMIQDGGTVGTFTYSDGGENDGVYALCRGMGAFDREGDILLAFPLATFAATDLTGVEELVLDRTLTEERDHPVGAIRTYRNEMTHGGETVATYRETDLELDGYDEAFHPRDTRPPYPRHGRSEGNV